MKGKSLNLDAEEELHGILKALNDSACLFIALVNMISITVLSHLQLYRNYKWRNSTEETQTK